MVEGGEMLISWFKDPKYHHDGMVTIRIGVMCRRRGLKLQFGMRISTNMRGVRLITQIPAYVAGQSTEFTFRGMPGVGWPFYIVSQVSIPFGNVPHLDMNASPLHRQIHLAGTFPNISHLHLRVPSGKLSHNYGTSQFSMDKSTNSLVIFNFSIVFSMFTRGSTVPGHAPFLQILPVCRWLKGKSKCVVATNRMAWAECQWCAAGFSIDDWWMIQWLVGFIYFDTFWVKGAMPF